MHSSTPSTCSPDKAPHWMRELRVSMIAAPMFLVSGPELVVSACKAGIVGSFPTLNARTPEILEEWLAQIASETEGMAPFAANLILHKSNRRKETDLAAVVKHKVPIVIASVGSPNDVVDEVHSYGGFVFADVATLRHAHRAVEAGVDGLVLLTAGAGGNTGWLNPFAFVTSVREFYDGPVAVAGCISKGGHIRALKQIGADLGYIGSSFLTAEESLAPAEHKDAVINATIDDIVQTDAVTGLAANFVRSRLVEAGVMSPDGSVEKSEGASDIASWKNVWSAGQGIGASKRVERVADIIARFQTEYEA